LTESASSRSSTGNVHYKKSMFSVSAIANIMRDKKENDNIVINTNHLHHIRTTQLPYPSINL
jgi:hypothetical protein